MTYFECETCGQLADLVGIKRRQTLEQCPVCEERTRWVIAFADEERGVSF